MLTLQKLTAELADNRELYEMSYEEDDEAGLLTIEAETAKLLNPSKTVLIPDLRSGCSLAESITSAQVRELRRQHPGVPVVTYVNTSAAVKAESDICCTSGNAVSVIESLGVPEVIMIPDQFLAANVARQTGVRVITHPGACEVHERFAPGDSWFVKQGTEVEWKILTPRFVKHYLANVETR